MCCFDLFALCASFKSKTVLFTKIFRQDSVLAFLLFMSIFSKTSTGCKDYAQMNCFSVLAFLLAAGNIWTDVSQASMMCFLLSHALLV